MCNCRHYLSMLHKTKRLQNGAVFFAKYGNKLLRRGLASRAFGWGSNDAGELGTQWNAEDQYFPVLVNSNIIIDSASCGYGTTFLFRENSSMLYSNGLNSVHQLGRKIDSIAKETKINGDVMMMSAGRAHTMLLSSKGVFAAGSNVQGQNGLPKNVKFTQRFEEIKLPFEPTKIRQIECGLDHSLLLTKDGKVFSTGLGADGQTGLGSYDCQYGFSQVIGEINEQEIISLSTTTDMCMALTDDGDVFGWGNNEQGQISWTNKEKQIAIPTLMTSLRDFPNITHILAGGSFSAVLSDGSLYVTGYGALGFGPRDIEIQQYRKVTIDSAFGEIASISGGPDYIAVLFDSGNLFTWGRGNHGRLGHGSNDDHYWPKKVQLPGRVVKFACGIDHMIVILDF